MTCNGYSNDETWQVSLWIEDCDLSEQELKDTFLNLKNEIFKFTRTITAKLFWYSRNNTKHLKLI